MSSPTERLSRIVDAFTEALTSVRALDTDWNEEEDDAIFDAKLALGDLDTGLVCPRFYGRVVLTYAPELAGSERIQTSLDALEPIDAIHRAAEIVALVDREGPLAAASTADALAAEMRAWA